MSDQTEPIRREIGAQLQAVEGCREYLESKNGEAWDTTELQEQFDVLAFLATFVGVRRQSDGVKGSVMFQASPRFYFGFQPE